MESCAACGKEADEGLKACKACNSVKYCDVNCQKAHWLLHKKACKLIATQLLDGKLFAQPPQREDCPICYLPLPLSYGCIYQSCCGKIICSGCMLSMAGRTNVIPTCPFCKAEASLKSKENNRRLLQRIEKNNDPEAMYQLGCKYTHGMDGCTVDKSKAFELFLRATEHGCAQANNNLAVAYQNGEGIEQDTKKAIHHWQVAAMNGNDDSRCYLAMMEARCGNMDRAMKHYMISAKCGHDKSLEMVNKGFRLGFVTKDDFEKTLRGHKDFQDETRSEQRDAAQAARQLFER